FRSTVSSGFYVVNVYCSRRQSGLIVSSNLTFEDAKQIDELLNGLRVASGGPVYCLLHDRLQLRNALPLSSLLNRHFLFERLRQDGAWTKAALRSSPWIPRLPPLEPRTPRGLAVAYRVVIHCLASFGGVRA